MFRCFTKNRKATPSISSHTIQAAPSISSIQDDTDVSSSSSSSSSLSSLSSSSSTTALKCELSLAHVAARFGSLDANYTIIAEGANLNAITKDGQTPFHVAIKYDNADFFRAAAKAGKDLKFTDSQGSTLLHLAAWAHSSNVITTLGELGLDPNAIDNDGRTPLLRATDHYKTFKLGYVSRKSITDAVNALIAIGANVNQANTNDRNTPLHNAIAGENTPLMKVLIDAGADVNVLDRSGYSLLDYVTFADIIMVLLKAGAKLKRNANDPYTVRMVTTAQQYQLYQDYVAVVNPLRTDRSSHFFKKPKDIVVAVSEYVVGSSTNNYKRLINVNLRRVNPLF